MTTVAIVIISAVAGWGLGYLFELVLGRLHMDKDRLLKLARGDLRFLTLRERVERDFAELCEWLKASGVDNPYYFFSKETWDFVMFQRYWERFDAERRKKADEEQRRAGLMKAVADASAGGLTGAVMSGILTWSEEDRKRLTEMLLPPAVDVQSKALADVLDGRDLVENREQ